jgi:hypothetical protein
VSVFSVSPSEWCNPVLQKEPKTYCTKMTSAINMPFYDKNASLTQPDMNMPVTVYRILVEGFNYYSKVPRVESLYQEFMHDDEIIKIIRDKKQYNEK